MPLTLGVTDDPSCPRDRPATAALVGAGVLAAAAPRWPPHRRRRTPRSPSGARTVGDAWREAFAIDAVPGAAVTVPVAGGDGSPRQLRGRLRRRRLPTGRVIPRPRARPFPLQPTRHLRRPAPSSSPSPGTPARTRGDGHLPELTHATEPSRSGRRRRRQLRDGIRPLAATTPWRGLSVVDYVEFR